MSSSVSSSATRCWDWRARGLPHRRVGPPPLPRVLPGPLEFHLLWVTDPNTLVLVAPWLSSTLGPSPPVSHLCSFQGPTCPTLQSV